MNVYLYKNADKLGPYSRIQIEEMLSSGEIAKHDMGWCEGLSDSIPVGLIVVGKGKFDKKSLAPATDISGVDITVTDNNARLDAQPNDRNADVEAQVALGNKYLNGEGVQRDYYQAYLCFLKAAKWGNPAAQTGLGKLFLNGQGIEKDYNQALHWFHKAADQDNASAQTNIGLMYRNGWGVPTDYNKALEWYHKANKQSYPAAQFNIGCMYEWGFGVTQDSTMALEWYKKGAERGERRSLEALKRLDFLVNGLSPDRERLAAAVIVILMTLAVVGIIAFESTPR